MEELSSHWINFLERLPRVSCDQAKASITLRHTAILTSNINIKINYGNISHRNLLAKESSERKIRFFFLRDYLGFAIETHGCFIIKSSLYLKIGCQNCCCDEDLNYLM